MCWPSSEVFPRFEIVKSAEAGDTAFVVYEAELGGKRVRNCEMHQVREGRITATEVYFGWNLPHEVQRGQHKDDGRAR